MVAIALDTLSMARKLESAEFTRAQAEALAEVLRDSQAHWRLDLATRRDLVEILSEVRAEFFGLKGAILKGLVPLLLGQAGLIVALVRLL